MIVSNLNRKEESKFQIINQGCCFINVSQTAKFYNNPKIIRVFRDPRDIFVSYQTNGRAYPSNVEKFIKLFKMTMNKIEKNPDNTIDIYYEDFILQNNKELDKIKNLLHFENIKSNYNYLNSQIKIQKYKSFPNQKDIELIKEELKQYLWKRA